MTIQEIDQIAMQDPPVLINLTYEIGEILVINEWVPLKVTKISNSFDITPPIPIINTGQVWGYLLFLSDKESIEISQMTEFEFISFLSEASIDNYSQSDYQFKNNYLVINSDYILDYLDDYKNTSAIWGGFIHDLPDNTPLIKHRKTITSIDLRNKLQPFDHYVSESCSRAIDQPYAFERFLKFYHLLELEFDYSLIREIKNLNIPQDSNKIGELLSEYTDKELQRLTDLIITRCTDIQNLEKALELVFPYKNIAKDMFIKFGKTKNNLLLVDNFKFDAVFNSGSFSVAGVKPIKIQGYQDHEHNKFITHLAAYWIYRIRCSIAHNKIGEYILSWEDEDFIIEFGEPLLKEILLQFYKK